MLAMYNDMIGIIGGMGSFATAHFFYKLLEAFPGEKEWDRPRVVIDNNCIMPSRVRAILYGENEVLLKDKLIASCCGLKNMAHDCDIYVVLACNTSHYFLPYLREQLPDVKFVDIIELCCESVVSCGCTNVVLLASEGTYKTKLYERYLLKHNISVTYPDDTSVVRSFIESVKQNDVSRDIVKKYIDMVNNCNSTSIILGCTELPIVHDKCIDGAIEKKIFDPLQCVTEWFKKNLK